MEIGVLRHKADQTSHYVGRVEALPRDHRVLQIADEMADAEFRREHRASAERTGEGSEQPFDQSRALAVEALPGARQLWIDAVGLTLAVPQHGNLVALRRVGGGCG